MPLKSASFNSPTPSRPHIHTMQQDLAAASSPSRFDLRHQRPLLKSQRMEDLRHKPAEEPLPLPLSARTPLVPPTQQRHPLTSPYFLWPAGIILSALLLLIIIALIFTV